MIAYDEELEQTLFAMAKEMLKDVCQVVHYMGLSNAGVVHCISLHSTCRRFQVWSFRYVSRGSVCGGDVWCRGSMCARAGESG